MKALIIVPESNPEWGFLGNDRTPVMLPFLDRSVLQHGVESLVTAGAKQIMVAPLAAADAVRKLVRDGKRWGIGVQVNPLQSLEHLPALLASFGAGELVLLVQGECLPDFGDLTRGIQRAPGWMIVNPETALTTETLWAFIADSQKEPSVGTPSSYLSSWRRFITEELPGVVKTGRTAGESIIVGRGARVHPQAKLIGPAYIGERSMVGADCTIGPNGYVCADCIVEDGTTVAHGVCLTHTYLGTGIELRRKIARNSTVYDLDRNLAVSAIEDFIVGSTQSGRSKGPGWGNRLLALLLGIVCLPLAVIGFFCGLAIKRDDQSIGYPKPWVDALARVAPGFWSVVAGRLHLVGRPHLSASQQRSMDELAPGLAESIPVGLFNDAYVKFGANPTDDELWASLAFTAASGDLRTKSAVWKGYLANLLKNGNER